MAGTVTVDPLQRRVETSRLRVTFDSDDPEILRAVVFKDFDSVLDLSADEYSQFEFWGQSARGTQGDGFILPQFTVNATWNVVLQRPDRVEVELVTETENQPIVVTRYTFQADKPWFIVDRTIHFEQVPDTNAVQVYMPRVAFFAPYRAVRWRDTAGSLLQRTYCAGGCVNEGWDGQWLQQVSYKNGKGLSVASIFPSWMSHGSTLARNAGPQGASGAIAPLFAKQRRAMNLRSRVLIAFSTSPDDLRSLDSLRIEFSSDILPLDVAGPAASGLALSAWPNPGRGELALSWSLPAAGAAELALFDVSGRRAALLHAGFAAAGPHTTRWDGRDSQGRVAAPGLYLARLVTAGGVRSARVVRVR
ncbi:MAG: hypothetical protein ABIR01_05795 [Candidatus Eisenbacteria bacterium]